MAFTARRNHLFFNGLALSARSWEGYGEALTLVFDVASDVSIGPGVTGLFFTFVAVGPGKATLMGANAFSLTGGGTSWAYDLSARLSADGSGPHPRASNCFSSGPFSACGHRTCLFWR